MPNIRTYRPVALTVMSSVPPAPVVVLNAVLKVVPSLDTWIWYALAQDRSHTSSTLLMFSFAPRSIRIHWGSTWETLAHRVVVLPSTAFFAT